MVMVLATPVLAMSLSADHRPSACFGLPIFDPAAGGDPLLFQHLFWFYSHPAVYIMILPAMGVVSEVFACFARRRVFGYAFMVFSLLTIGVVGFMVWGHHMFVAGQSPLANLVFSFLSFIVAVPSAIKVFNWTATLYRGHIGFEAPMIYALGFLGLFTIGGLTGLFLASVPIDIATTDTYFVVAHFHTIMVGGTVSAFMAGIHYWWPKVTGKLVQRILGAVCRHHHVPRLQRDVPAAVRHGLARHAAPLSLLSGRFSDLAHSLQRRRGDPRRRLSDAAALSRPGRSSTAQRRRIIRGMRRVSNGRRRHRRRSRTFCGRRALMPILTTITTSAAIRGNGRRSARAAAGWTDMSDLALREPWPDLRHATRRRRARHVDLSGERSAVLRRPVRDLCGLPQLQRRGVPHCRRAYPDPLRLDQHRASCSPQPDDDDCACVPQPRSCATLTLVCLGVTAALGLAFLLCKGLEYRDDLAEHLFPGPNFPLSPPATQMFWGLYWIMTGIHAVHLSVGIGVVLFVFVLIRAARHSGARFDHGRRGHLLALRRLRSGSYSIPLLYLGGRS